MNWVLAQRVNAWERKPLVSQFHFTPLPPQKPDFSENNTCLTPIEPYSFGKNYYHTTASVKPKCFCIRLWDACCKESPYLELPVFLIEVKWEISLLIISTSGQNVLKYNIVDHVDHVLSDTCTVKVSVVTAWWEIWQPIRRLQETEGERESCALLVLQEVPPFRLRPVVQLKGEAMFRSERGWSIACTHWRSHKTKNWFAFLAFTLAWIYKLVTRASKKTCLIVSICLTVK